MSAFEQLPGALRLLRDRRGLTQRELAAVVECTVKQISAYETGRQKPRIETLERILAALGADALDLAQAMESLDRLLTDRGEGIGSARDAREALAVRAGGDRFALASDTLDQAEMSEELRELAPRLPALNALANELLVELLAEAVERRAKDFKEDLISGRLPIDVLKGDRDELV